MNLSQRTIRAGSWQLVAVISKVVLQLFVLGVLARYVLPKDFGLIAMANMVMVFVDMFADAGIGPAIIQKKDLSEGHIKAAFFLSIALGVFFVFVLWVCAPFIAAFFKADNLAEVIRWIGFSALISKAGTVSRSRLEREMRFDVLMWIDVGSYLLGYALVGLVMAVMGYGVWAIVAGKLAQCGLQTIFLLAVRPNSVIPVFSGRIYGELIAYGGGLTLTRVFDNIASQADYFIVGRFLGPASLGFYDRAAAISSMPGQYLNSVLDKVLFPAMSQVQDQPERLSKAYFAANDVICALLMPLTALMLITAPEIVSLLLGPGWHAAVLPFRILLVILTCRILISISDTLVRATGAVYASAARKAILAVLIIVGSLTGRHWGLPGVAVSVDISLLIGFFMMLKLSGDILGYKLTDCLQVYRHGIMLGLALAVFIFPVTLLLRFYNSPGFLVLGVAVLCSAAILLLITLFLPKMLGKAVGDFLRVVYAMSPLKKERIV